MDITINNYSQGRSKQHNSTYVVVGDLTIYFSYRTPVAFSYRGKQVVRQNDWSTTTGKHLNWIDGGDKASRVSGEEFQRLLEEAHKANKVDRLMVQIKPIDIAKKMVELGYNPAQDPDGQSDCMGWTDCFMEAVEDLCGLEGRVSEAMQEIKEGATC
jgi:hypothetical protein